MERKHFTRRAEQCSYTFNYFYTNIINSAFNFNDYFKPDNEYN